MRNGFAFTAAPTAKLMKEGRKLLLFSGSGHSDIAVLFNSVSSSVASAACPPPQLKKNATDSGSEHKNSQNVIKNSPRIESKIES